MILVLFTIGSQALAQDDLVADRPKLTESSQVVMNHRVVFEGGVSATVDRDKRTLSAPELLMRLGVLPRVELRFRLPDIQRTSSSGIGVQRNLGETYVGAKAQLFSSDHPFGLAVMPGFTAPTDPDERGGAAPELVVSWSNPGPRGLALSGRLAHEWREGARRGADRLGATLAASGPVGRGIGAFAEWVAEFPSGGEAEHVLHHGYTLEIYPDGQLDAHIGFGLTPAATDYFLGLGITVRH